MTMTVPVPETDKIYRDELLSIMQAKIDEHPRSAQVEIGPSEVGGCRRKVAWKMAYGGDSDKEGGWAAHKGTLIHAWLDDTFSGAARFMPDGGLRFHSDLKLPKSHRDVNGGTLDLYDQLTQTVVDWKAPGEWTIKAVRNGQISWTYYAQTQIYGYGLERMGFPVSRVAIMYLPMCGDDLHSVARGAILCTWPYEPEVAIQEFAAIERIRRMLDVAPARKVLEVMEIKSDFCANCPAFVGSGDRRAFCQGVTGRAIKQETVNPFA